MYCYYEQIIQFLSIVYLFFILVLLCCHMALLVLSIANSRDTDQIIYICSYIEFLAVIVVLLLSPYSEEFHHHNDK